MSAGSQRAVPSFFGWKQPQTKRYATGKVMRLLNRFIEKLHPVARTPTQGASSSMDLRGVSPEAPQPPGQYASSELAVSQLIASSAATVHRGLNIQQA
jgi:hypothetical protein